MAVSYKINDTPHGKFKIVFFNRLFLIVFFSSYPWPNYTKFCTYVVEGHLAGTVSQIFCLCLSFIL